MAMTSSKHVYRVGYGPLPSGFHQVPFPYCVHCPSSGSGGGCCGSSIQAIKELMKETSAASDTAAIILEPILGEGESGHRSYGAAASGTARASR